MHAIIPLTGKRAVAGIIAVIAVTLLVESAGPRMRPVSAQLNPEEPPVAHTLIVTKRLVDANDAPVAGDLAGYQFVLTGGPGCTGLFTTNAAGTATLAFTPRAGTTCTVNEIAAPNRGQLVRFEPGNAVRIPGVFASVTLTSTTITAVNRVTAAPGGVTRSDALVAGCNNLALLYAAGTPLATVAAAVAPAGTLVSIFRFDAAANRFLGFAPGVPEFVNDYRTVGGRFEAVFFCMRAAGTLTQPAT